MLVLNRERFIVALGAIALALAAGVATAGLAAVPLSTWGYGAGLIAFLTVAPALIVRYARRREGLSPLPALTIYFMLNFAGGAVYYRNPRTDSVLGDLLFAYTPGSLGIALVIAFGAWVLIVIGYHFSRFIDVPLSHVRRPQVNDIVTSVAGTLIVIGWAARVVMLRNGWYFHITDTTAAVSGARNITVVLAALPLIATAMIGARYYRDRPTTAVFFWTLVLIETPWAVLSGGRAPLLSLGITVLVVRAYASRKAFPVGLGALFGVIVVLVVFPLVAAYRDIGASSNAYNSDPIGRMGSAATQMVSGYDGSPRQAISHGVDRTLERFAALASIAAIVHHGTEFYPVQPGGALATYAGALVPRAVLPSKRDSSTLGKEFGVRYGIIPQGNTTSVAMSTIGDLWGTFGFAGLALGMLAIGAVVRGLNVYLRERRENYAVLGLYAATLGSFLLSFDTSVATGLLQTLRALVIYIVVIGLVGAVIRLMRGYAVRAVPPGAAPRGLPVREVL